MNKKKIISRIFIFIGVFLIVTAVLHIFRAEYHNEIGKCFDKYGSKLIDIECDVKVCDNCKMLDGIIGYQVK